MLVHPILKEALQDALQELPPPEWEALVKRLHALFTEQEVTELLAAAKSMANPAQQGQPRI